MKNEKLKKKNGLDLKKRKIIEFSFNSKRTNYVDDGTDATHGTTVKTHTTGGDADAIMIAYITI